jgi:hypothetical protein
MRQFSFYMSKDRVYRLFGIFFLAFVLFNFPFLYIAGKTAYLLGIPIVYVYIFSVWLLIILFTLWNFGTSEEGEMP